MSIIGQLAISRSSGYCKGTVSIDGGQTQLEIIGADNLKPALHGDRVELQLARPPIAGYKVARVITHCKHNNISGLLQLNSTVIYGTNKRGLPIYIFKPTDHRYPHMLVATKMKHDLMKSKQPVTNFWVTVTVDWEAGWEKFPRANLQKVLGWVGEVNAEYLNIIYGWGLFRAGNYVPLPPLLGLHPNSTQKQGGVVGERSSLQRSSLQRSSLRCVISIDPQGCQDIDDALHVENYGNLVVVGVHIADVSSAVPVGSKLFESASRDLTTIYTPIGRYDMLPEAYSTDLCSLKVGQPKNALTTLLHFSPNGEFLPARTTFNHTLINVAHNLSYETAQNLLDTTTHSSSDSSGDKVATSLQMLSHLSHQTDTHKIVEYFMVLTNRCVGEYLYSHCKDALILRVHQNSDQQMAQQLADYTTNPTADQRLASHLKIVTMQSAKYVPANATDSISHYGLNCQYYTHFTSPIRRFVDLYNHALLSACITSGSIPSIPDLPELCQRLNQINADINRAERQFKLIELVTKWEQELSYSGRSCHQVTAYITEILTEDQSVTVYLPDYDVSKIIRPISAKLDTLVRYQSSPTCLKIIRLADDTEFSLNLLDRLNVDIVPNLQAESLSDKFKIQHELKIV